jgi:ferredoxin
MISINDPRYTVLNQQAWDAHSYGKYLFQCRHCGRGFRAGRLDAKYCGASCRVASKRPGKQTRAQQRAAIDAGLETKRAQSINKTCEVCGASYWVDGTQTASMYCGAACRQKAYRQRKMEEVMAIE